MPLYEYKCASCGDVFEVIQKFGDAPLTIHDACGGSVKRLISSASFHFKGSGWYVNDYGKSGKANTESSSGKSESKSGSESKSDSKSESKSESKTESKSTPAETKSGSK